MAPSTKLLVPGTRQSILSHPLKMQIRLNPEDTKLTQVYSFGLTAGKTCPGATYAVGHKCRGCYAKKGNFLYASTKESQNARTQWTLSAFNGSDDDVAEWIRIMKINIEWATIRRGVHYLRIHHAGDFFSARYIRAWIDIVRSFPTVKFWTPTSSQIEDCHPNVFDFLSTMQDDLKEFAAEPNVTCRPSPRLVGYGNLVHVDGMAGASGILKKNELKQLEKMFGSLDGISICPAKQNGNRCADCRVCWDNPELFPYYMWH